MTILQRIKESIQRTWHQCMINVSISKKISRCHTLNHLTILPSQKEKLFYDVAILGWWYGENYGSILTYYGLNKFIESCGYSVLMVHEAVGYDKYRIVWPKNIMSMQFARRAGYHYTSQMHFSKLLSLNEKVNTFIVGSDQLWNPNIGRINDDLFLDFVENTKKRIAYATSFGDRNIKKFSPDFIRSHHDLLKRFDAISVREDYGVHIARNLFNVESSRVIDPVFLLTTEKYRELGSKAPKEIITKLQHKYLAAFFLDPSVEKQNTTIAVANKLGIEKIVVIPNPECGYKLSKSIFSGDRFEVLTQGSPEIFLSAYENSSYIITDSFHGTAFAIIFKKPFSSIYNRSRGIDRFKDLLKMLGYADDRRLREKETAQRISANPHVSFEIDHRYAHDCISHEVKMSANWFMNAL